MGGMPVLWSPDKLKLNVRGPGFAPDGQDVEIQYPFVRIGRAPNCDLVLDHEAVSRWHAYLHRTESGVFVIDLGSREGTRIDGTAVLRGWLVPDKPLSIGPFEIRIEGLGPAPDVDLCRQRLATDAGVAPVTLRFTGRTGKIIDQELDRVLTIVGRDAPSNLRLADDTLARTHLLLYQTPQQLWAVNLAGVHVYRDDHRVDAEPLEHQYRLRLGKYLLVDVARAGHETDSQEALLEEIAALRVQVQQAENECSQGEKLRQQLAEEAKAASDQVRELTDQLAAAKQRIEELEPSVSATAELVQLQDSFKTAQERIEQLESEASAKQRAAEVAQQRIVELEKQLEEQKQAESQFSELGATVQSLTLELQTAKDQLEQSAAERDRFINEQQAAQSKLQEYEERTAKLDEELQTLKQQLQELQQREAELTKLREEYQRANQDLQRQLEQAQYQVQQLREEIELKDRTYSKDRKELQELRERLISIDTEPFEFETLQLPMGHVGKVAETDRKLAEVTQQLYELQEQKQELETRSADLACEKADLSKQLHELQKQLQQLQKQNQAQEQQLQELLKAETKQFEQIQSDDIQKLTGQLDQATSRLGDLEQQLSFAHIQIDELQQQLRREKEAAASVENLTQSHSLLAAHAASMNESLKREIEDAQSSVKRLTEQCGHLEQQHHELMQHSRLCSDRIEIAETQAGAVLAELDLKLSRFERRHPSAVAVASGGDMRNLSPTDRLEMLEAEKKKLTEQLAASQRQIRMLQSQLDQMTGQAVADDYFSFLSRRREGQK